MMPRRNTSSPSEPVLDETTLHMQASVEDFVTPQAQSLRNDSPNRAHTPPTGHIAANIASLSRGGSNPSGRSSNCSDESSNSNKTLVAPPPEPIDPPLMDNDLQFAWYEPFMGYMLPDFINPFMAVPNAIPFIAPAEPVFNPYRDRRVQALQNELDLAADDGCGLHYLRAIEFDLDEMVGLVVTEHEYQILIERDQRLGGDEESAAALREMGVTNEISRRMLENRRDGRAAAKRERARRQQAYLVDLRLQRDYQRARTVRQALNVTDGLNAGPRSAQAQADEDLEEEIAMGLHIRELTFESQWDRAERKRQGSERAEQEAVEREQKTEEETRKARRDYSIVGHQVFDSRPPLDPTWRDVNASTFDVERINVAVNREPGLGLRRARQPRNAVQLARENHNAASQKSQASSDLERSGLITNGDWYETSDREPNRTPENAHGGNTEGDSPQRLTSFTTRTLSSVASAPLLTPLCETISPSRYTEDDFVNLPRVQSPNIQSAEAFRKEDIIAQPFSSTTPFGTSMRRPSSLASASGRKSSQHFVRFSDEHTNDNSHMDCNPLMSNSNLSDDNSMNRSRGIQSSIPTNHENMRPTTLSPHKHSKREADCTGESNCRACFAL